MKQTLWIFSNICAAPSDAFSEIKQSPRWGWGFFILVVITLGISWAILPYTQLVARIQLLETGNPQLRYVPEMNRGSMVIGLSGVPLMLLIKTSIFAGCLYLGVRLRRSGASDFKVLFAAVIYAELIPVFSVLINAALVLSFKEMAAIETVRDLHMIPSLSHVFGDAGNGISAPYFTFLRQMNPFSVWYLYVLSRGVAIVADLSKQAAMCLVTLIWLAGVGVEVAMAAF